VGVLINWKVRLRHKPFLVALSSGLLLSAKAIGGLFGYEIPDGFIEDVKGVIEPLLYVLVLLGVVVDPTTHGIGDSEQAKSYKRPRK
jgi:phi LC3 family holin